MTRRMTATIAARGIGAAGIFFASAGILPRATTKSTLTSAQRTARAKVATAIGREKGFTVESAQGCFSTPIMAEM